VVLSDTGFRVGDESTRTKNLCFSGGLSDRGDLIKEGVGTAKQTRMVGSSEGRSMSGGGTHVFRKK